MWREMMSAVVDSQAGRRDGQYVTPGSSAAISAMVSVD
jgi:hypothetical protein